MNLDCIIDKNLTCLDEINTKAHDYKYSTCVMIQKKEEKSFNLLNKYLRNIMFAIFIYLPFNTIK